MKKNQTNKKKPGIRFFIVLLIFLLGSALLISLIALLIILPFRSYLWIAFLVILLIDIITAYFIVNTNVNSGYKIAWLAVCLMIPLGGCIMYFLFADKITNRKLKKLKSKTMKSSLANGREDSTAELNELKEIDLDAHNIANYIYESGLASIYKNTNFEYYKIGDLAFEPILEALKKAKKFIYIEYFIIEPGVFFDSIYEILIQKAKEGVDVRLLYDDFGSVFKVKAFFFKEAQKNGIKCHAFNRIRPSVDIRQNNRDHRKMIIIDGVVGFSGGMNIADEYINKVVRFGLWKDNGFKLTGEAVTGLTNLFVTDWNFATLKKEEKLVIDGHRFKENLEYLDEEIVSDGYFQPFGDIPFDGRETARDAHLSLILKAKKSIYLCTPYFIPDSELLSALVLAAQSGVDVKVITPGIPDKKMVYQATRSYYSRLLMAGVKVYEFTPGFNHEKMMVVDGKYVLTGTVNFDYRSFYLHFENDVFICNCSKISEMENDFLEMVEVSKEVDKDTYLNVKNPFKRLYWGILRIIAPLL